MNAQPETVPCQVCDQPAVYQFSKLEQPYYVCAHCGAVGTPQIDPKVILTENHSNTLRHQGELDDVRLQRMDHAFGKPVTEILDFGCGQGEFVAEVNARGRRCRGIDQHTELQLRDVPDASIDAINLVEVIEHLYAPREIFAEFQRVLKPGGIVHIETSIVDGQGDLTGWDYLDPRIGHCLVHSSRSLEILGERTAFKLLKCNNNVFNFQKSPLELYIAKREGRYVYLSDELLAMPADVTDEAALEQVVRRLAIVFSYLEPFYFQCGGAGDALLLLATCYDTNPHRVLLSYPNSIPAMRSFFDAFPALEKIYFLPAHANLKTNDMLRSLMPKIPNCLGRGVTPSRSYVEDWTEQSDVFHDYGVVEHPEWAKRSAEAVIGKRITIAPRGSLVGMAGSKRNIIESTQWTELLQFIQAHGYTPVIIGTPDERADYPHLEGCEDQRSYSFREQMEQIAYSARFVGADSWAKTFAALAGVPSIVFEAIKGRDWRGQKDPSDYVFLDPWQDIQVVSGLEVFKDVFTRQPTGRVTPVDSQVSRDDSTVHIAWEGSFVDNGSLSHVNRELTSALSRHPKIQVACIGDGKRAQAPTRTQITVRHAWPPNWQRPKFGAWVLIQPWEFGTLPTSWVARLTGVDEVWVPSEYCRRVYVDSGVTPSKVKVVPNGIDPQRFSPAVPPLELPTRKSFKFLFVGGTIHRKGPDLLLKAYLEKFTAADDVCLVIKDFGSQGVYAGQTFEQEIRAAQAQPNAPEILYLNEELPQEKLPGLYTACDCLVHPYRGEGFSLPVLEAMACGLPVIVTAGGATDDFATDEFAYRIPATRRRIGYNVGPFKLARPGWLLEPALDELMSRLQWVFGHREEARAKGRAASECARREWTWERAAQIAAQQLREVAVRVKDRPTRGAKPIELPATARLGHLGDARELLAKKHYREAWAATLTAMEVRPFHPEARELLKEISRKLSSAGPIPKPTQPPRLSVCLITRNEEDFIERCLQSVRDVAWQVVVVDTGSTDRTREIARGLGAEIHEFKWCDDFSAARNVALEHVRGDWVLVLDADEELTVEGREALRSEMLAERTIAYRLPIVDVGKEDEGYSYVPRLFRNAPGLFYVGRIHEQVFSSLEVRRKQWGLENRLSKTLLRHHGYTPEIVAERNKIARNLQLLELAIEEMPEEPNLLMNYGLELARSGQLPQGLEQYLAAFRILRSRPKEEIVPELRESLLTQLCTQLMAARRFEEIVTMLGTPLAREHGGLTASLHFAHGLARIELGQYSEAAEQFRQCLEKRDKPSLTPMNRDIRRAGPHHCLAICLVNLKQYEAAGAAFQAAVADDPQSRRVRFDFAVFLANRGSAIDALKHLHALIAEKSGEMAVWQLGGKIALGQPQLSEFACDWTGEALKLFPAESAIVCQRAEALLLRGRAEEALPLWRQSLARNNPSHVAALMICELCAEQTLTPIAANSERQVSVEFLRWYQRFLTTGASGIVTSLNERADRFAEQLPTASDGLREALLEPQTLPA